MFTKIYAILTKYSKDTGAMWALEKSTNEDTPIANLEYEIKDLFDGVDESLVPQYEIDVNSYDMGGVQTHVLAVAWTQDGVLDTFTAVLYDL